jgi:signal transduction histidine kinase
MNTQILKLTKRMLRKSVHLFYECFLEPKSENEDSRRRELILNVLLIGTIFLLLILGVSLAYNQYSMGESYQGLPITVFSYILAFFVVLYAISRAGYFIVSSYIFVFVYLLTTLYGAYAWGVDLPSVMLSYALVIVMASILINTRFAFWITFVFASCILLIVHLAEKGVLSLVTDWRLERAKINDAIVFGAILFLIWIVSWLSNREIEKSLIRARKSEAALKEERDLLEIKVEERTRELKQAQLEKMEQLYRFAEFGKLSSGMFHDLVNPLTALALNLERLKDLPVKYNSSKPYLEKAVNASKRMENFLSALRRQIQKQEIRSIFVLNEETEQAIELLGYKARKGKVGIRLIAPETVITYGNPLKFYQVVANLVSNAIDAYENLPANLPRNILVSLYRKEDSALLIVKDWAVGMDEETQAKIFDPFFTTKSTERGSGIGLSTVKQIVEADFGGEIELDSKPGHGAMFTITFKLKTKEEDGQTEPLL